MTIMSDMLAEYAKAMEENPSNWWNHFEYDQWAGAWRTPVSPHHACEKLLHGFPIRRKLRTVTRLNRHGERVELPEPMRKLPDQHDPYWFVDLDMNVGFLHWRYLDTEEKRFAKGNCFPTQADAQAWADYFKSLLESRDE